MHIRGLRGGDPLTRDLGGVGDGDHSTARPAGRARARQWPEGERYLHIQLCRPSPTERGRRRQGREEEVSGAAREREAARGRGAGSAPPRPPGAPPAQASPRSPAHLGISQHDVLDARWPAGLGAFHAHVVDLVAADLAVLPAGRGRAPQHADGRGVERLRLHLPRRRAGHWQGERRGGPGGAVTGALGPAPGGCPMPGCRLTISRERTPPSRLPQPGEGAPTVRPIHRPATEAPCADGPQARAPL